MMLSFFSVLSNAVTSLLNFIVSSFSGILSVFSLVGQCWSFLTVSWAVMPSVLLVFITAGLTIVIVFHLIGR